MPRIIEIIPMVRALALPHAPGSPPLGSLFKTTRTAATEHRLNLSRQHWILLQFRKHLFDGYGAQLGQPQEKQQSTFTLFRIAQQTEQLLRNTVMSRGG